MRMHLHGIMSVCKERSERQADFLRSHFFYFVSHFRPRISPVPKPARLPPMTSHPLPCVLETESPQARVGDPAHQVSPFSSDRLFSPFFPHLGHGFPKLLSADRLGGSRACVCVSFSFSSPVE